jgi:hypothetical protein
MQEIRVMEIDGECFPEADLAVADVIAVRTNAEEHEQKREHNRRVADVVAPVKANLVVERHGGQHHQRR